MKLPDLRAKNVIRLLRPSWGRGPGAVELPESWADSFKNATSMSSHEFLMGLT